MLSWHCFGFVSEAGVLFWCLLLARKGGFLCAGDYDLQGSILFLDCQGSEYTSVMQHVYQEKIAFHFFKDNTSKLAGPDEFLALSKVNYIQQS